MKVKGSCHDDWKQGVMARKTRTTLCTYMCLPISPNESSENNLIGSETFALYKRNKQMLTVRELQPSALTVHRRIIPAILEIMSYKPLCSEHASVISRVLFPDSEDDWLPLGSSKRQLPSSHTHMIAVDELLILLSSNHLLWNQLKVRQWFSPVNILLHLLQQQIWGVSSRSRLRDPSKDKKSYCP